MLKYLLLLILIYVIYLHIFGQNYYLITIFLIKVCPIMCFLITLSGNLLFSIYFLFHFTYRLFIYDIKKFKIPSQHRKEYAFQMSTNSTKFINYHVLNKPRIDNQHNYIYLYSPHSLYAHGFLHLFGSYNNILQQPIISLVHKFFFLTPFLGDLFDNCGFMECNYTNLDNMLLFKKSVGLIPGGLDEAINTVQNKETIYINKRKGIFELAIKHNTPIIPIMSIGESDFYSYPMWSHKIPNKVIRLMLYTFSWGKKYIPWMSQKKDIHILFGDPIYPSFANNKKLSIDTLKESYIKSLKNLHRRLNNQTGQKRELIIL